MDEEMKKRVEERAQDILDDPRKHEERWRRRMAERIAYYEILEEDRERAADEAERPKKSA